MNTHDNQLENTKINDLAEKYTLEGFAVTREPSETNLPFDLGGYRPDLIVTKDNSGFIVEVKDKLTRLPVERFRALAEEVGKHPGWRFLLVTLDDEGNSELPGVIDAIPDWSELSRRTSQAFTLLAEKTNEPALLYLWGIFEAILRRRATEALIPIERFPALRLINHMYSLGELSVSQHDLVIAILEIRNKLAHGFLVNVDGNLASRFATLIETLLAEWVPHN